MKRLSWKYVAGLVDGEGCLDVSYTKNKDYPGRPYISPRVRVTLTEPAKYVIYLLQNNYNGNIYARHPDNDKWLSSYTWQLTGKKCRPFLQNIKKHLLVKQEQAKFLIFMIDKCMGKSIGDEARIFIKNTLKAMKRDPQRLSDRAISELKKLML